MKGVWTCGLLTTFWAVFASVVAIFPGFLDGQLLNDAGLPEDVSRAKYTTIAAVAIGITFLPASSSTSSASPFAGRWSKCR